jgi:hypothetical protein
MWSLIVWDLELKSISFLDFKNNNFDKIIVLGFLPNSIYTN